MVVTSIISFLEKTFKNNRCSVSDSIYFKKIKFNLIEEGEGEC